MKQDPALNKKLSDVEERQNRWLGRRVEAHDAPTHSTPPLEQDNERPVGVVLSEAAADLTTTLNGPEASAPESELEQLTVGSSMGPSGQGGERDKLVEEFEI